MTLADLIDRIAEAYDTYRRLPDPDRKYRQAHTSSWPTFVRDFFEAYGLHDVQIRLAPPTPGAIDRAEQTLSWMAIHLKDYPIGAKIIWLTYGRGLTLEQCAHYMHRTRRLKRSAAWMRRDTAMKVLAAGITRESERVPA